MNHWVAFAFASVLSCVAIAADSVTPRPSFEAADANRDGKISLAEFQQSMERFVEKRAAEGGQASRRSPQTRARGIKRVFSRLDANGDSMLDAAEWEAGVKRAREKAAQRGQLPQQ